MAVSIAFVHETIPFMKTVERLTNPCFQDTEFASVMKGKHVMNAREETMLESVGEVSGSEKESVHDAEYYKLIAGSDNWSENDDENQNNPLTILLHQATQSNLP